MAGNVSSNVFTLPHFLLKTKGAEQPGQVCKLESCLGLVFLKEYTLSASEAVKVYDGVRKTFGLPRVPPKGKKNN